MTTPRLRVAYDATPLIGPRTGIGWLTAELLACLAADADLGLSIVCYAVTWRGRSRLAASVPAGVAVATRPMAARPLRTVWSHTDLAPIEWWSGGVDVVHGTNFVVPPARRAARVVTVHDMTAWRHPELVDAASLQFPHLLARALRRGSWIHTNSRAVAAEVVADAGADPARVVVVPPGIPDVPAADPALGRRLAGSDRYLLALGTVEPRKDLPSLVRAFDTVATGAPELRLVIAGADGWGASALDAALAAARHRDRVVRLGYVGEAERAGLLRGAAALAYPSLYEGFGFPPLEAMSVGVPVVATRAGSIPEVCGDAALLTDAGDVEGLAAALERVLHDDTLAAGLKRRGHGVAAGYSWARTATEMAALYRRAAA